MPPSKLALIHGSSGSAPVLGFSRAVAYNPGDGPDAQASPFYLPKISKSNRDTLRIIRRGPAVEGVRVVVHRGCLCR